MLKKIESIRRKPRDVRNRYAFGIAFSFTFIVASFWLASMPAKLSSLANALDTTNTPETQQEVTGGFSQSFASLRASVFQGVQLLRGGKDKAPDDISLPSERTVLEQSASSSDDSSTKSSTTNSLPTTFTELVTQAKQANKQKESDFGKTVLIATSSASSGTTSVDY